jgi:prefoldin subunit 5
MTQTSANIADDALDLLRATHERINQMRVLFNSIIKDLKHGKSNDVEELASLGGFLGYDWANYVDCEVEKMQKTLDSAEVAK